MRKAEKNNSSSENRIRTFKMNDFGKNKSSVIAGSILAVIISVSYTHLTLPTTSIV